MVQPSGYAARCRDPKLRAWKIEEVVSRNSGYATHISACFLDRDGRTIPQTPAMSRSEPGTIVQRAIRDTHAALSFDRARHGRRRRLALESRQLRFDAAGEPAPRSRSSASSSCKTSTLSGCAGPQQT
jgi:hypothetical protein